MDKSNDCVPEFLINSSDENKAENLVENAHNLIVQQTLLAYSVEESLIIAELIIAEFHNPETSHEERMADKCEDKKTHYTLLFTGLIGFTAAGILAVCFKCAKGKI